MNLNFHSFNGIVNEVCRFARGRRYNVEYRLGNDKITTFNNVLDYADGEFLYFLSREDGMDVIKQENLISMVCTERKLG